MRRTSATGITFLILLWAVTVTAQTDISALENTIRNGSVEQKRDALFALRNLRSAIASGAALPALADMSEIVRATAAGTVVFLRPADAASAVLPLLNDQSAFVRREAAYALGETGDSSASTALAKLALRDKDLEVRSAAVIGLGRMGDPNSIDVYISILNRKPTEETGMLRRSAARAIGQTYRKLSAEGTAVVNPQNFLPEKFKSIGAAASPAGTVPDSKFKSTRALLLGVLQNGREADDTRREAVFALGESRDLSVAEIIRPFRSSPDPYLAEAAKEALLKIEAAGGLLKPPGS